jgi:hypothetical protein
MKTLRLLTAAALLLAGALAFAAATPPPAFTAAGNTCADITWKQETVAKYPNVADACQGVVQRNGETYVKFVGVVQRVTPSTPMSRRSSSKTEPSCAHRTWPRARS